MELEKKLRKKFKHTDLQQQVQHNCHISDARHAGNYTLCIYLLKMREYYRWERGLGFDESIGNTEIGSWLTEREDLWESLEDEEPKSITIDGTSVQPYDADGINKLIENDQLIYSAGYILRGKPHFFLADISENYQHAECNIVICGKEYARELSSPPAMSQGKNIFIRKEALRRTIWEKVEESLWIKNQSPLVRAIACYDFKNNLEDSLTALCESEIKTLVAHETGEIMAGEILGESWKEMIIATDHLPLELMLRAIRDNLADCLTTLHDLTENGDPARIHFYIANISNMRKSLFPALREAYDSWLDDDSPHHFAKVQTEGKDHWLSLAKELQELFLKEGKINKKKIQEIIDSNIL